MPGTWESGLRLQGSAGETNLVAAEPRPYFLCPAGRARIRETLITAPTAAKPAPTSRQVTVPALPRSPKISATNAEPSDQPTVRATASMPLAAPLRSGGPAVIKVRLLGV